MHYERFLWTIIVGIFVGVEFALVVLSYEGSQFLLHSTSHRKRIKMLYDDTVALARNVRELLVP